MPLVQNARRRLYRGKRPGTVARFLNNAQASLAARGLGPARIVTLVVRGHRTGKTISLPVVVADYEGDRYLVSMFGVQSHRQRLPGVPDIQPDRSGLAAKTLTC